MPESTTASTSISPPSGTGMVAGMGEAFSLDLNSGQGNFSIPFEVPNGVAGFKPGIKLEYTHGNGNGAFGLGWRLAMRKIERRLDFGVPADVITETFLDTSVELRNHIGNEYKPVREQSFTRYQRQAEHWELTEKDGRRQFFGVSAAARVADPERPDRVQSWLLEREVDINGNQIDYHYMSVDGYTYLSSITYAKYVVRFSYQDRPDPLRNGRAGFMRLISQRCHEITLHLASDNRLVRRLTLAYQNPDPSQVSLLASAQLTAIGHNQANVVKNPVTLNYSSFDSQAFNIDWISSPVGSPQPPPLTDRDTALLSISDLPIPGILTNSNGRYFYWSYHHSSNSGGQWEFPRMLGSMPFADTFAADGVQFIDMDGTGTADMLVGVGSNALRGYYQNAGNEGFKQFVPYAARNAIIPPFESGRIRLFDLQGDGIVDALYSTGRGFVSYRNGGAQGWREPSVSPPLAGVSFDDPLVFMADMSGDGFADIVRIRSGRVEYWPNIGHGRFADRVVMEASPRLPGIHRDPEQIFLLDVDGDGCSDLVRVSATGIELYINRSGHSFAAQKTIDTIPVPLGKSVRAVDLEGHGRFGLLYNSQRAGQTAYVHFNWKTRPASYLLQKVDNGVGLVNEISYAPMVDMAQLDREDGKPWQSRMPFPLWVVSSTLETDIIRGRSLQTDYRYHEASFDPLFRRFQGFRQVDRIELGDESRASVRTRFSFLMNQTEVPGNTAMHAHLDRMLARVETFSLDSSGLEARPYRVEETDYDLLELDALADGSSRVFTYVHRSRKRYLERSDDERVEEMIFNYDQFGNVIEEISRGYGTLAGNAVPALKVITQISYASDPGKQIFAMARTLKRDHNNNLMAEVRRYYDGNNFVGLPPGQLSRGLLVKEEHLVLGKAEYDSHYADMTMAELGYFEQQDSDGVAAVFTIDKQISYTPEGNQLSLTTGLGRTISHQYDTDKLHTVAENANGKVTTLDPDPIYGKPRTVTSDNGEVVIMRYDAFGRLVSVQTAGDSDENPTRRIRFDDSAVPNAMQISYRLDASSQAENISYYDGNGNEIQKRVQRGAGDIVVSAWLQQNPWGQTKAEFEPTLSDSLDFSIPDTSGREARRMFFDGEGRLNRTVNYNGGIGSSIYNAFEITIADANDNEPGHPHANTTRREQLNVWNQRIAVIEDKGNGLILTTYDIGLFGEIRSLHDDSGSICSYQYDRRGNRLSVNHRDAGLRRQWFDSHNDIVRTRDSESNDVSAVRDVLGRIVQLSVNGAVHEEFSYDDVSPGADGRLGAAVHPEGKTEYFYNARGQTVRQTLDISNQLFVTTHEYNDLGRETATAYPNGTRIERSYTDNGLVRRIENIVDQIDYDARNLPVHIAFANGVSTDITYAPGVGQVVSQRTQNSNGTLLEDLEITRDLMQELISLNNTAPGAQQSLDYSYDALMQLTQVSGSDPAGSFSHAYNYVNGYSLAANGESGWTMHFDHATHPDRVSSVDRPGEAAFTVNHTANGNISSLPGRQLRYDVKNQLRQVDLDDGTVIQYNYDHRGARIRRLESKNGNNDETIYLGRHCEVHNGSSTNFVILNRARIAVLANGQTRWVHLDPLGSANFFTDESGTKIAQIAYNPFGNERRRIGSPDLRSFALHDYDDSTKLFYMGRRWYSQELGRFLTPDPLYLYQPDTDGANPLQMHLYTYVGNDPMNKVDPSGLSFWSVVGAIVGVIVGIIAAVVVVAAFASGIGFGVLAVAGIIALITVSYVVAANNQGTALGEFFRGFMIGFNAGMNATLLTMLGPVGAFLGGFVGTMIFLGAFDTIASTEGYQGIMGWSNWIMPMSWLVTGVGLVMWLLNGLGHLLFWSIPSLWGGGVQFFRIDGMRMDWSTGMLATRGGWVSNLNTIDTAYNMGNWAFVDSNSTGWHLDHEAGHNLNLAVFGSIFHFIGFIHEMGTGAGSGAFSEVLADSNVPGATGGMWA